LAMAGEIRAVDARGWIIGVAGSYGVWPSPL
jgi:hypothetical protein